VRVLYFSKDYTSHDRRFLEGLSGTEHEVFYLRLEDAADVERRPLPHRISPVQWGAADARPGVRLRRLRAILHELQPDVVHAGPVQACSFLAAAAGARPLVTMSWGSDILVDARRGWGRWKAKFALKRSEVFLCDCQVVREHAIDLGMSPERIVVFPWGVDLEHFKPGTEMELRHRLGWQEALVILSSRSFEPIYGVDTLVRGWIDAAKANPGLRLLLLGKGSREGMLRQIIDGAGLTDLVHFAGQVGFDELPDYIRSADVYVSASHSDGSSISLLEAMACGLPAVVSDIPGNREWVEPETNGWWFRDGDGEALGAVLRAAASDGRLLKGYGAESRRIAEERADWRHNFQKLLEGYHLARRLAGGDA